MKLCRHIFMYLYNPSTEPKSTLFSQHPKNSLSLSLSHTRVLERTKEIGGEKLVATAVRKHSCMLGEKKDSKGHVTSPLCRRSERVSVDKYSHVLN